MKSDDQELMEELVDRRKIKKFRSKNRRSRRKKKMEGQKGELFIYFRMNLYAGI